MWELFASFVLGVLAMLFISVLARRWRAAMELKKMRADLVAFVERDERLNALFPPNACLPNYSASDTGATSDVTADWMELTQGGIELVQAELVRRVAGGPLAIRSSMTRFGKMIRARLVILLGLALHAENKTTLSGTVFGEQLVLLAQVGELMHVASLLHDDVVDEADLRRGGPSHRALFGNQTAVLTGDTLVSILVQVLVELDRFEVTQKISLAIEALVIGELLQMSRFHTTRCDGPKNWCPPNIEWAFQYIRKSYFKTASLFSALMESVAFLIDPSSAMAASAFGFHFGLAFQLIDDVLDFDTSAELAGKPVGGADVANGTATLPVLLAAEDKENLSAPERLELKQMIERRFAFSNDHTRTMVLLKQSNGIQEAKKVVTWYLAQCEVALAQMIPRTSQYWGPLIGLFRQYEVRQQ